MKKETKSTEQKKEAVDYFKSLVNPLAEIIEGKFNNKKGNMTTYPIGDGISLSVVSCENAEHDMGTLNVFGVAITLRIMYSEKNDSYFAAYPSYQNKSKEYVNYVNNYSKTLNSMIKECLKDFYAD